MTRAGPGLSSVPRPLEPTIAMDDDARWSVAQPTSPGLYRTRIRLGSVPSEEDLIAVAALYDGTLAYSRALLDDDRTVREWLGPLAFSDLKRPS